MWLVNKTSGNIKVLNDDIDINYKSVRSKIGLVPQELYTDMFETVSDTVDFQEDIWIKTRLLFKRKNIKGFIVN